MSARLQRRALCAMAPALTASATDAETIYRCGDSFQQSPCADARAIEVVAAPTEAQRAEARAVAAREKQLAFEMARDRREREAAIRPAAATSLSPPRPMAAASAPAKRHSHAKRRTPSGDDGLDFIAAVPSTKK